MEAIELAKQETFKQKEHEASCQAAGRQVGQSVNHLVLLPLSLVH